MFTQLVACNCLSEWVILSTILAHNPIVHVQTQLCRAISTADAETAVQTLACLSPHDSHACVDMQLCMVYINDELSLLTHVCDVEHLLFA